MKAVILHKINKTYSYIFFDDDSAEAESIYHITFDNNNNRVFGNNGFCSSHYYKHPANRGNFIILDKSSEEYTNIMQKGLVFLNDEMVNCMNELQTIKHLL